MKKLIDLELLKIYDKKLKDYTETELKTLVANLIDSAPETLNTLNELATALGNDPNFATTITTEISKKIDKEDGKGLSTNDYTNEDKQKLTNLPTLEQIDDKLSEMEIYFDVDENGVLFVSTDFESITSALEAEY